MLRPAVAALAIAAALLTGCDDTSSCSADNPCDEGGNPLIFVPFLMPGTNTWIQPGQPGYQPTYQNRPPSYRPPSTVNLPRPGYTAPRPAPAPAYRPAAPAAPRPVSPPAVRVR